MDSILPMGGFQLPFQRRLSRLYNDTKKSSDFVKEPAQHEDDPEIKALYRKLRIQKDRFVSWGLEWSDPNQSAEIDESLSKAGLSEVVGSIMSTIKDILAEAEPLWLSYKRVIEGIRPSPDRKAPLVQWDKGRFEDLIRDLTASIDTLYDLSRMRSSDTLNSQVTKSTFKSAVSEGDFRPFESTRMQTPQQIDPRSLTHLQPVQDGLSTISASCRNVVYMSKTAYSELTTQGATRQPWAPLLLEYANFDPIYSTTGIMPPMARFEKLSAGLQQDPQRAPGSWTGLPRLLGYFEDLENSRLGLVYLFPPSFNTLASNRVSQNPQYSLPTLSDLLARGNSEPPLEAKFRFAYNLANTVFDMHARGITHGNLFDANISFSRATTAVPSDEKSHVDIRRPVLSSFDVFTEEFSPTNSIWKHPLDPRSAQTTPLPQSTDERVLEVYSLAMILLSIGLWTKLENLAPRAAPTTVPESALDALAIRCGTLYMKAVQACWKVVDDELSGKAKGESLLSAVQMRVTRFLEACCILDGVSGFEERLGQEPSPIEAAPLPIAGPSKDSKDKKSMSGSVSPAKKPLPPPKPTYLKDQSIKTPEPEIKESKPETKVRLYPHVPLPPDVVDKWNSILMPQINIALKSFYRKHPESVEISLESVGPSPHQTRPTVLVVCTSVGKVRAILKKRLSELFDDSTGFGLKVCRGSVIRSRRQAGAIMRSMARGSKSGGNPSGHDSDDDHVDAVNPEYQERPNNGASIGAWIGDRHLPPVSFGGLVIVDEKTYGMTVHHMLDDPDRDFGPPDTMRSSAIPGREWLPESTFSSFDSDDYSYELSDTESEPYSETDITSDYEDDEDEEDEEYNEPGDIPGIEPGCGDGYIVTQPALDDVEEGFYPYAETEDEDHLDTFSLGEVYASSGIRRKQANGLIHEVDWALFEFADGRLPEDNSIPKISDDVNQRLRTLGKRTKNQPTLRPTTVAPWSALPGLEVQCVARTSGLQTGQILPALTSVKIYGRQSPSHTYQIASTPIPAAGHGSKPSIPLGIPGDSGAWIVDRQHGQLCGHVLAWSPRKHVAYICPMDVLLLDIAQTLEATEVRLPGGEPVVMLNDPEELDHTQRVEGDCEEVLEDNEGEDEEYDMPPALVGQPSSPKRIATPVTSSSPIRLEVPSELQGITRKMDSMKIGNRRIDVNV
ncbi:het-s domain-containing [Trichoderma arundinaceum]|uniref:Het-s domain-containing n=1 Tax=Trichoderma arundinaceum TaxID=490622 RepID=A0A395NL28_TRIAR|nr:het-s domain-containing [Trichoderma arundinaceum]